MDKFDYEMMMYEIRLLEIKIKRINIEKEYLYINKPSFIRMSKKKEWLDSFNKLIEEEKNNIALLEKAQMKLGNIFE